MHGIADSVDAWVMRITNSPVQKFLDGGFEVWAGNSRGNKYNPPTNNQSFWDFSLGTMGKKDVPSMVDFIRETTGQEKITYIGHS